MINYIFLKRLAAAAAALARRLMQKLQPACTI
jgi:hypothetical protein